jgi:DNA (cytosine-5)-methyltransferase 3A
MINALNSSILFLQENVGSASKLDVGIMSRALGVYPVRINSSLLTAQLRDRYYWSNIKTKKTMFDLVTDIPQPKDKKIFLKDIITDGEVKRIKALALLESESRICSSQESIKKRASREFINIIYLDNESVRTLNKIEMCRLQGFPDNYCDILSTKKAGSLLGDGWTLPIIEHIFTFIKR